MNNDVAVYIQNLSAVGEDLHRQYVKNVISGKTSISETLSKVGFSCSQASIIKAKPKSRQKLHC